MGQSEIFVASEGNRFYERNKNQLRTLEETSESDQVVRSLQALSLKPTSILEIGCSNGWRLAALRQIYNARCVGIDPSAEAVADGSSLFPDVELRTGTAEALPFADSSFEIVVFGFCLYLCDRKDLFRITAESDRVLQDKGYVAILDFLPPFPYRNQYTHCPGVYSYKMNYSSLFLCNPMYTLISQTTFTHDGMNRLEEPDERVAVSVLLKRNETAYPANPFKI